jgi:hypothetical protein
MENIIKIDIREVGCGDVNSTEFSDCDYCDGLSDSKLTENF